MSAALLLAALAASADPPSKDDPHARLVASGKGYFVHVIGRHPVVRGGVVRTPPPGLTWGLVRVDPWTLTHTDRATGRMTSNP